MRLVVAALALALALPAAAAAGPPAAPTPRKLDPPRLLAEAAAKSSEGLAQVKVDLARQHALDLQSALAAVARARAAAVTPASTRLDDLRVEALKIRELLKTASAGERGALQRRIDELLGQSRVLPKPGRIHPE